MVEKHALLIGGVFETIPIIIEFSGATDLIQSFSKNKKIPFKNQKIMYLLIKRLRKFFLIQDIQSC